MVQQFVRWFPLQDQSPRPDSVNLGIHKSEKSAVNKPVLPDDVIIQKLQEETKQLQQIADQKSRFDELNKSITARIPIEQRTIQKPVHESQQFDHSLLIEQIRELVIGFNEMLLRVLKPDYPVMRSDRKKYAEEVNRFQSVGFREYVRAVKIKIDALCTFEGMYDKEMFEMRKDGKPIPNWFDKKVDMAVNQKNFGAAQEVMSSITQILMQDEIVMHKRKILSKMK